MNKFKIPGLTSIGNCISSTATTSANDATQQRCVAYERKRRNFFCHFSSCLFKFLSYSTNWLQQLQFSPLMTLCANNLAVTCADKFSIFLGVTALRMLAPTSSRQPITGLPTGEGSPRVHESWVCTGEQSWCGTFGGRRSLSLS